MGRTSLPPGFRFHPTDVELVMYYLKRKITGKKFHFQPISDLNIYKFSPWDLPDKSCLRSKDLEWFFFCPRERKYASGARANRATETGYWKSTGKDRPVLYHQKLVGMVRTLVFQTGRAPAGQRTDWVMHEYRMEDQDLADSGLVQDSYVLCKVFKKSGLGPKNGAHYGAPFNEEDWNDDEEICAESSPVDDLPLAAVALANNQNSSAVTSLIFPGSTCSLRPLSEPGPSTMGPSVNEVLPDVPPDAADEISSMLAIFTEDSTLLPNENDNNEKLKSVEAVTCSDPADDIYSGLGDLGSNWADLNEGGFSLSSIMGEDISFLELNDLNTPLKFPNGSDPKPVDTSSVPYNKHGSLEQFYPGQTSG